MLERAREYLKTHFGSEPAADGQTGTNPEDKRPHRRRPSTGSTALPLREIQIVAVESGGIPNTRPETSLLEDLAIGLEHVFPVPVNLRETTVNGWPARDAGRSQFHSTLILRDMRPLVDGPQVKLLAVATVDLFVPVLTFVFGEAQVAGNCALVSLYRLREDFYGLPPSAARSRTAPALPGCR